MRKKGYSVGFMIFLLLLWQILAMLINARYILPSPLLVLQHLKENLPELMMVHFPMTMKVVLIGSLISVALGLFFAVLMTMSSSLEKAIYPLLTISQTIPTMCLAPIFVLWLGYTTRMRVLLVVLMNFFAITVNVFDGFMSVRKESMELMKTYGANRFQQFYLLQIPTAMPYFFTSLKVTLPWSVVGAAVAEWFGAPGGLGNYSRIQMMSLDAAGLLAPLVIISITALILSTIIKCIEKKLVTWGDEL